MGFVTPKTARKTAAVCLTALWAFGAAWAMAAQDEHAGTPGAATELSKMQPLKLTVVKAFPEVGGGQQGIATDGEHVYVQSTHLLVKYDLDGNVLAKGAELRWHHGGITYHDGKIYAAVSECCRQGTDKHWVCVYDAETLEQVAGHDVGKFFGVCTGGIAYLDGHFYVAESYFDNDHDDFVVKFDADFNFVQSFRIDFKCPYGIQGLDYVPSINKFLVNSHAREFYLIDPDLDSASIEPRLAPFELQDVACLDASTFLFNDRSGKKVAFVRLDRPEGPLPRGNDCGPNTP